MTLKDEVREILKHKIQICNCEDDGCYHIEEDDLSQATEAIMERVRARIKTKKQIANSNRIEIDLLVEGYNQALEDLLTEMGGTK